MIFIPPDLQGSINRIHRTIELMYSDKSMMQVSRSFLDSDIFEIQITGMRIPHLSAKFAVLKPK